MRLFRSTQIFLALLALAGSSSQGQERPMTPRQGAVDADSMKERLLTGLIPVTPDDFRSAAVEQAMSLQDVVDSALRSNHDIKVASHKPAQARAGIMEAQSAYDPEVFADWQHSRSDNPAPPLAPPAYGNNYRNDTERMGMRQHLPTGGALSAYREWNQGAERTYGNAPYYGRGGAYGVELSQPLLNGFGDRENRAVIEISRLQSGISDEEFRQTVIKSMSDAIEAYWSVAQLREEVRIYEDTLRMAESLMERERKRQEDGMSMPLDLQRASEAVASRGANLLFAREQQQATQEKLKLLLNSVDAPIGTDIIIVASERIETPLVKADMDESIDTALANRPEMRTAELSIRTGEVRQGYARHNLLPKLDIGATMRRNDRDAATPTEGSGGELRGSDWSLGVSFSMPIGNMKARAAKRRADSELAQHHDEKQNIRAVIITEVKTAVRNLELLVREIPVSLRAVEAARKVVEGEWARLELNQVGNRDLLQAQDLLAVTERNHIQTLIRYNIAIMRLLAAEGTLLERLMIRMK